VLGEIPAVRHPEKYILTELNVKKGPLQSQNPHKGKDHFFKKAMRRASSKLI